MSLPAEGRELWAAEVQKALANERTRASKLHEYVLELQRTEKLLKQLPERLNHDVMVPFGKVAMFPGKLVHTNEVLVKMGEELSAEMSVHNAVQVLRQRQEYSLEQQRASEQHIEALQARERLAGPQKNEDGEDVQDIVEHYDEEVHGSLEGPAVPPTVSDERKRFGPPRTQEERLDEDNLMLQLAEYVAGVRDDDTPAAPAEEHLQRVTAQGGAVLREQQHSVPLASGSRGDMDKDTPSVAASCLGASDADPHSPQATGHVEGDPLEEELHRLMGSFHVDAPAAANRHSPAHPRSSPHGPLIQEVADQPPGPDAETVPPPGADPATRNTLGTPAMPAESHSSIRKPAAEAAPASASGGARSGLQKGFFNSQKKPARGILKKSQNGPGSTPAEPTDAGGHGPRGGPTVSQELLTRSKPSAAEEEAFSGVVRERGTASKECEPSPPQPASHAAAGATRASKPVSRFKVRRMASSSEQPL